MQRHLKDFVVIAAGAPVAAFGINGFLVSHGLADGGLTGLAMLLHYTFGWAVGITYMAMNIPLLIWFGRLAGAGAVAKTFWGALTLSVALQWLAGVTVPTTNTLLGAIYGGALLGVGLGIIFRAGGTTGGADIIARIVHHYAGLELGRSLLAIDIVVIGLVGLVLGHEAAMYSLIAMFVATRLIDALQEGLITFKALTIISDEAEAIRQVIIGRLNRGVTVLTGQGGFTGTPRQILYCVVTRSEVGRVKNLAHEIDPAAFVVVADAREVLGEGFVPPPGRRG